MRTDAIRTARTARPRRRWRRCAASALLLVGAGSSLGLTSCRSCEQPYRPVGTLLTTPVGPPTGDWPVTGEPRPVVAPPLDTDGDGVKDGFQVDEDGLRATIHRSSGDLVLTMPASARALDGGPDPAIGDLDGDGLSEAVIVVFPDSGAAPTHYVVPGATPDGTYEIDEIAAVPMTVPSPYQLWGAGDIDGDGLDDVAFPGDGETPVWLGADLDLTVGTPPAAGPSEILTGQLQDVVALDGRNALSLQTRTPGPDTGPYFEVTLWVPEGGVRFTTEGSAPNQMYPFGYTSIVDDGDTTWLVLSASSPGGLQQWAWDLHDLCAGSPID